MNLNSSQSVRPTIPVWRWAGLTGLIVAEVISLSLRYDAKTVPKSMPWHALANHAGELARIGLAMLLATALVAGPAWYRNLMLSHVRRNSPFEFGLAVFGNLISFLCFYFLSARVLEGDGLPRPSDWALFAAWLGSGVGTLLFWGMAFLPWEVWIRLGRVGLVRLVAGSALGGAAYMAGLLARDQWRLLSQATLWLVHGQVSVCYAQTIYRPEISQVGTLAFQIEVSPECSGYEGMGLIAALMAIALVIFRRDFRFPRSLLLLPLAVVVMWLSNTLRITALIVLGTWGYRDFAMGGFHSMAGWVLFLSIGLGMIAWARRTPFWSKVATDTPVRHAALDAAYLVPMMAIIATSMVTTTLSPGLDRYYPARVIAVAAALLIFRKSYSELRLTWSWEAVAAGFGVFALWLALEPSAANASSGLPIRPGPESLPQGWLATWLFFRVIGSVVMVPLAEELAFRGYLTRRLISSDFQSVPPGKLTWVSFLVSSILFGVLHGRWVAGTLAGMAFALVYRRRGQLTDAVVAHAVANGLIAVDVLATGAWSLWG